jgi:hypothetical protein
MSRVLSSACLGLLIAAGGCAEPPVEVAAQQPINFPHDPHLKYFSSGRHRAEKIGMHLEVFGQAEPPEELAQGRCAECHDDLAERAACAGCHVPFQNAALRAQREIRPCVGCHRGAWAASAATIPSGAVCISCHEDGGRRPPAGKDEPRLILAHAEQGPAEVYTGDLPWVRINTMPPNVYFSHTAHVRFASMACTNCHQDVRGLVSPPTLVRTFSMSECLGCHAAKGASTDCLTCHK